MAVTQSHYRFGIDELTEATHGWHAAEDTSPSSTAIALDTTFLLRINMQCDGTAQSNVDGEFQYRINGGTWTAITTTSTNVRAVAATALTNGGNCTKRLSGTGTFESTGAGQTEDGISGGTANDIVANGCSETECGLQLRSADLTTGGEHIEFRLTRDGGTLLDTYSVTPRLDRPMDGDASISLGALTTTASGAMDVAGVASLSLGSLTQTSAGAVDVVGSATISLGAVDETAEGVVGAQEIVGSATIDLGALDETSQGTVDVVSTATIALGALDESSQGAVDVSASLSGSLAGSSVVSAGAVDVVGLAAIGLSAASTGSQGVVQIVGASSTNLGTLTLQATGGEDYQAIYCHDSGAVIACGMIRGIFR